METLTREQEAARTGDETPPEHVPETAPTTVPCATCGAPLQAGQEWCLECGTARPDRLVAGRPSWRGGATVLAVTGVLVAGAAAAAWAGLSADAKRVAASTTQAALPPATSQPAQPAAPAPPPPAAAQPPAATTPPPSTAKKAPPPAATPPAKPTTAAPPSAKPPAAPKPSAGKPKPDVTKPQHTKPVAKLVAVDLKPEDASTYNPYNRAGTESADPKLTVDGDPKTAWTASVDPAAAGRTAIGVDVALGKLTGLRSLKLSTPTPGMTIEIYGAKTKDAPVSVQDPGWTHITTQLDVAASGRIRLGDGTEKYRHLLIWITEASPQGTQVALGELQLFA